MRAQFEGAAMHYLRALDGTAGDGRLAPRPRRADAVHAEEARPPRRRGRAGRGRDAALAGLARLLLHPRRPAARLRREHARSRRRAAAADRIELAARARDRRAAAAARQRPRPRQLPRGAQPRGAARRASATTPRRAGGASAPRRCARTPEATLSTRHAAAAWSNWARDRRPFRRFAETARRLLSSPSLPEAAPRARRADRTAHGPCASDSRGSRPFAGAGARPSPLAGRPGPRRSASSGRSRRRRSSRRRRCTATRPMSCTRRMP